MSVAENNPPMWPYTLDYAIPHKCWIPPCPTKSYPGLWEVPLVHWEDLLGYRCAMADACHNPGDTDEVYQLLMNNFKRHYETNRAPFGMYYHSAWFIHNYHMEGFKKFLDTVLSMPDVWVVTTSQALQVGLLMFSESFIIFLKFFLKFFENFENLFLILL
jgi:hypothetical protein